MSPQLRVALGLALFAAIGAGLFTALELLKRPDTRAHATAAIVGALIGGIFGIWLSRRRLATHR